MINFILTKGDLTWQYERSILTAYRVNQEPIVLWYLDEVPKWSKRLGLELGTHLIPMHTTIPDWLKEKNYPAAYIYDYLALETLNLYGGLVMGMDNISIRPYADLLGDYDICVSCDVPFEDYENQTRPIDHPFNNAYLGKPGTDIANQLLEECTKRLKKGYVIQPNRKVRDFRWGDSGPGLLTDIILANPDVATWGPFPSMTGWEGSYIWKYYCGLEEPHPNTRIIHLFSSAYRMLYSGVPTAVEQWVAQNPDFEWVLPNKMPDILKKASWV